MIAERVQALGITLRIEQRQLIVEGARALTEMESAWVREHWDQLSDLARPPPQVVEPDRFEHSGEVGSDKGDRLAGRRRGDGSWTVQCASVNGGTPGPATDSESERFHAARLAMPLPAPEVSAVHVPSLLLTAGAVQKSSSVASGRRPTKTPPGASQTVVTRSSCYQGVAPRRERGRAWFVAADGAEVDEFGQRWDGSTLQAAAAPGEIWLRMSMSDRASWIKLDPAGASAAFLASDSVISSPHPRPAEGDRDPSLRAPKSGEMAPKLTVQQSLFYYKLLGIRIELSNGEPRFVGTPESFDHEKAKRWLADNAAEIASHAEMTGPT